MREKSRTFGELLAAVTILALLMAMLTPLLSPEIVKAANPNTPVNVSPLAGATDVTLTPTLRGSAFSDPDVGDTHAASRWQITDIPGNYSSPVFDSEDDTTNLYQISIPAETLDYSQTYYWHVRYQDSNADWSAYSTETSFTTTALRKWTFMVYLDADNNMESAGISNFNQMELAGSTSDVNIVVLMDRTPGYDTSDGDWTTAKLYHVTQDSNLTNITSTELADWGEVNMGHPNTLEDFATWTIQSYPAQYYALVLWDHGDVRGVCWDDTSGGDYLTEAEIKEALRAVSSNTGVTLDILGFDACLMGMAEIDYQIRDYAAIRVGSEDLEWAPGWPYDDILQALTSDPDMTPTGLASQIVNDYIAFYDPAVFETMSAVKLSGSETLAGHVSDFAQSTMDSGEWDDIAVARAKAEEFRYPDYEDGYVDLYHFAQLVQSYVSDASAQADAQDVMNDINGMVLAEAHGMMHSNARGVSIFFPEGESDYWTDYCRDMDFAAETRWDEFLLAYRAAVSGKPDQPTNDSPINGATDIGLTHTFRSSDFNDGGGDTHYASQWQITTTPGDYSSSVFDSGVDTDNLVEIEIASDVLYTDTTYYWHVRHQDDTGVWSAWSTETSFTTIVSGNPSTPTNVLPADGATNIALTPTLESSAFVSPDAGATHAASRWQVATDDQFANIVYDSGIDSSNLTQISVPAGYLGYGTIYYWRVKYQDDNDNWSEWSAETSLTTVVSGIPKQPTNLSPADGTIDIVLAPGLLCSAFSDPDMGDSHYASRWQIASDALFASIVYDSSIDTSNLTSISIPSGMLSYDTTYYWRVRHQDSFGNWSDWSAETSFTTVTPLPPNRPANESPANGDTGVSLSLSLYASAFSDPDVDDAHTASQWQITTTRGDYSSPVFDSDISTSNLVKLTISSGTLGYDTTYYWRVKYRDRYDEWSGWSQETSFTTLASSPPRQPDNVSPSGKATGDTSLTLTLKASAFSDTDPSDVHTASQWQITITAGDYSTPTYDSEPDTSNLTQIAVPSGVLDYDIAYYWHVRYQDSYENWSDWSEETSFTTAAPQASFSATPTQAQPGQPVTFTDLSKGDFTSWTWDFGDGKTKEWNSEDRPEDGKATNIYLAAGTYTVSLKVTGPTGEYTKDGLITVSEPGAAEEGGGVPWVWIAVGLVVIIGVLIVVWMRRR